MFSLQCYDIVVWATGRASGLYKIWCWFAGGVDIAHLIASVVTTSIILSSSKIQNGDVLDWY